MEIEIYKVIDCFKPKLAEHEWKHLDVVFNSLGTNDTYKACGYFGSKTRLKESLEPEEEISDQALFGRQKQEIVSYPGLENLLKIADEKDVSAKHLIIWNGR